jgi:hypothetical protein
MPRVKVIILLPLLFIILFHVFCFSTIYALDYSSEPKGSPQITYNFDEDDEYQETQLRRFETIFFISLPASFLFSFLGFTAYRWASGRSGSFTSMEYRYLIFSTIGTSLSIAIGDNRVTYRKDLY